MKKLKHAFNKRFGSDGDSTKLRKRRPAVSDPAPQTLKPQAYHHIPKGSGGVLSREPFSSLLKPATFVGTTTTLNTVGVFFEISDTKCFIAHINAYITESSPTTPTEELEHYNTNFKTTALLREALTERLSAAVPGERTQRMRDSLVMTCARLSGQESRAAETVAKTVREWLGAELTGGGRVAAAGSALVAWWPGGDSVVFEQDPDLAWSAVDCGIGLGAWNFGIKGQELKKSEEAW